MSITKNNYFEASKGCFKIIPATWVRRLVDATDRVIEYDYFGTGRLVSYHQQEVLLGNRRWIPNFYSYSGKWVSTSAYWTSEDGQYLLRVSDHWSLAPKGVHQCGNIRKCWWELAGRKQPSVDGLWGGIIKFSDLSERR